MLWCLENGHLKIGLAGRHWNESKRFTSFFVSCLQDFLHTENLQEFWDSVLFSILILRYKKNSLAGRRANTWLASGFRAVITGVLGDLDYLAGTLQLPRWSKAHNSCCLCLCSSSGENSWKIFKEDAPWIQKIWTPSTWEAWEDKSPCKLFAHTKHPTACSVQSDWMHAKYLGVDMVTFASILWLCMYVVGPDSPNENLQAFERHLKEFYKNNRVDSRYSHFNTFKFFQNQKGLKLKGKAAQIKEFGRPLLSFWEKLHNEELRIHKLILVYLKLNVKIENILDDNKKEIYLSYFTSTEKKHILWKNFKHLWWNAYTIFSVSGSQEAATFKTTCFNMAHIHSVLWEHFQGEDLPVTLFTITSKLHWMMHSALLASYISPRRVWCFKGEDFMKCTQLLAASCVSGNSLVTSTLKMLQHWRVAFHLQWAESSWTSWQIAKKK